MNGCFKLMLCVQISQRDILNSIEREMSGDLKEGMKTVGKCVWSVYMCGCGCRCGVGVCGCFSITVVIFFIQ